MNADLNEQAIVPVDDRLEFRKMLSLNREHSTALISKSSISKCQRDAGSEPEPPLITQLSQQERKLQDDCGVSLQLIEQSLALSDQFLRITSACTSVTEKHRQRLHNQRRVLELRRSQLLMVLYLLECRAKLTFRRVYTSLFKELDRFAVAEDHINNPLNHVMLETVHRKEISYLKFYLSNMKHILSAVDDKGDVDGGVVTFKVKRCKVLVSKLYTIAELYPYAAVCSKDDLFSEDLNTSKRWAALKKNCLTIRIFGDKKAVLSAFSVPVEGINIINAMLSKLNELSASVDSSQPEGFLQVLKGGFGVLNYAFVAEKAQRRAELFLADPDKTIAMDIWNMPESRLARPFVNLMLPSIRFMKLLYIPRHFPPITIAKVGEWVTQMNFAINDQVIEAPELADIDKYTDKLFEECEDQNDRVRVRVLSPFRVERIMRKEPGLLDKVRSYFGGTPHRPRNIILHIHGGGFISQSSYFHQMYTRNWSNSLDTAIFSVDYRLAPNSPYPAPLDDCYQVYMWLSTYLHKVFDVPPQNIVVVGDSAGGNIIASLTGLLIKLQHPVPKGIVLVYPALSLNFNGYSPSLLSSLDDMLLPHTFLKMCLSCYVPEEVRAELDPFASPVRLSDNLLRKYPPCRMFVGNRDPMHDDCCRLTERLMLLKRDIHLTVYDNMGHAFLQMDLPFRSMKYSRMAVDEIEAAVRELLSLE